MTTDPETGFADEDGLCHCGCDRCTSKPFYLTSEHGFDIVLWNCPDPDCDGRYGLRCASYYESDEITEDEARERVADRILAGVE